MAGIGTRRNAPLPPTRTRGSPTGSKMSSPALSPRILWTAVGPSGLPGISAHFLTLIGGWRAAEITACVDGEVVTNRNRRTADLDVRVQDLL